MVAKLCVVVLHCLKRPPRQTSHVEIINRIWNFSPNLLTLKTCPPMSFHSLLKYIVSKVSHFRHHAAYSAYYMAESVRNSQVVYFRRGNADTRWILCYCGIRNRKGCQRNSPGFIPRLDAKHEFHVTRVIVVNV